MNKSLVKDKKSCFCNVSPIRENVGSLLLFGDSVLISITDIEKISILYDL
jgi:hypothetical protein